MVIDRQTVSFQASSTRAGQQTFCVNSYLCYRKWNVSLVTPPSLFITFDSSVALCTNKCCRVRLPPCGHVSQHNNNTWGVRVKGDMEVTGKAWRFEPGLTPCHSVFPSHTACEVSFTDRRMVWSTAKGDRSQRGCHIWGGTNSLTANSSWTLTPCSNRGEYARTIVMNQESPYNRNTWIWFKFCKNVPAITLYPNLRSKWQIQPGMTLANSTQLT